jgi:hypothetical protein
MSLHFNWSRLDETCAEALRQLINKRLAEVVERINADNSTSNATAADPSHRSSPASSSHPFSSTMNGGKGSPGMAGGDTSSATGASSSLVGLGGTAGSGSTTTNGNINGGLADPNGSPRGGQLGAAAELSSRSPFFTTSPSNNLQNTGTTRGGTGSSTAGIGGGGGTAAAATGSMPLQSHVTATCGGSGPHGLRVDVNVAGMGAQANDEAGGVFMGHLSPGYGGVAPPRSGAAGPTLSGATSPMTTTVSDLHPAGGNVGGLRSAFVAATRATAGSTTSASYGSSSALAMWEADRGSSTSGSRKVPPIVYLEVGSVEWGTTPPFVEIVAFENATEGPPGFNRSVQRSHGGVNSGEARDSASHSLSHTTSTDVIAAGSSPALAGGGGVCLAGSTPQGGAVGEDGGDNNSESSHDFAVSHPATGLNTPRIVTGGYPTGFSQQTQASTSLSQIPSQPGTADTLASVLGYGGLHIRFHITYGGALHLSLCTAVQHDIRLGAVSLRVSLPVMFYLANLDLDCYLCINVKNNACQVWLEHGPLSSSVVNRLSITATFGGDSDADEDGVDYGTSSTDFYSRFGSSSVSDDDNGEGDNGVYVNEHEVSQFILHELRAILHETIVAPHCITIPISFGG